jgi:hypothetical protein
MKLDAGDLHDLRPLISETVRAVLNEIQSESSRLPTERLGFTEREAAALIGVKPNVLGGARRRGEVRATRIGKQTVYERGELLRYLMEGRDE